jgi:hypothetical protein
MYAKVIIDSTNKDVKMFSIISKQLIEHRHFFHKKTNNLMHVLNYSQFDLK